MDMSSPKSNPWFSELDVEDPMLLQEFVGDCLVDYPPEDMAAVMDEDLHYTFSSGSECNSSTATAEISNNAKRQKPNDHSCRTNSATNNSINNNNNSNSNAESMENTPSVDLCNGEGDNRTHVTTPTSTKKPKRLPDQCHNHIMAERQRRQTLSQRFIALSALIPGLKKMDKTSVLGEAINHMTQLKEKLKMLEEVNAKKAVESVVVVKRSQLLAESESNSSSDNDNRPRTSPDEQLPEIEARFSNGSVLIKIHCEMQKGILTNIISEIENVHLSVTNTSTMPFNNRTLDVTIMAQMEPDFDMRPHEVVRILQAIF